MYTDCCVTRAVLQRFVVVAIREVLSAEDDCMETRFPGVVVWVQLAVTKFFEYPRWVIMILV
jgi:hypothetical protein